MQVFRHILRRFRPLEEPKTLVFPVFPIAKTIKINGIRWLTKTLIIPCVRLYSYMSANTSNSRIEPYKATQSHITACSASIPLYWFPSFLSFLLSFSLFLVFFLNHSFVWMIQSIIMLLMFMSICYSLAMYELPTKYILYVSMLIILLLISFYMFPELSKNIQDDSLLFLFNLLNRPHDSR